jgi:hypothetical protein
MEKETLRKLSACILLLVTASSVLDDFEREAKLKVDKTFWLMLKNSLAGLNNANKRLVGNLINNCCDATKSAYSEDIMLLEKIVEIFVNDIETCEEIVKGIEVEGKFYHLRDYLAGFENANKNKLK